MYLLKSKSALSIFSYPSSSTLYWLYTAESVSRLYFQRSLASRFAILFRFLLYLTTTGPVCNVSRNINCVTTNQTFVIANEMYPEMYLIVWNIGFGGDKVRSDDILKDGWWWTSQSLAAHLMMIQCNLFLDVCDQIVIDSPITQNNCTIQLYITIVQ